MVISKRYIKNTVLIGLSFILLKSFNLILPYFLDSESYNAFNKVFYYASLISTIGTFGFTYALTQINLSPILVSILVFVNIIISYIMVFFLSGIDVSYYNLVNIFIISFAAIIFSIYNFRLLFFAKTKRYFISIIIFSFSHYLALFISVLFSKNILFLYAIFGIVSLIFCIKYFQISKDNDISSSITRLYKLGASTFVINSTAGIILMADKFFANNIFDTEFANSYTFAWAIIAPIFYLGNIAEKNIYAAESSSAIKTSIKNSLGLIFFGLTSYFVIIYVLINYFSYLLPQSIELIIFNKIVFSMLVGYAIYIFLHFPINGVLFKFNLHAAQKFTALGHIIILGIFALLLYLKVISIGQNDFLGLLYLVLTVLFLLSLSKIAIIFISQKKEIIDFFSKA